MKSNTSRVPLLRSSSVVLIGQLIGICGVVLLNVLVARTTGAAGRGEIALTATSLGVVTVLGGFGAGPILVRQLSARKITATDAWKAAVAIAIVAGGTLLVLFRACSVLFWPTDDHTWLLWSIACSCPILALGVISRQLLIMNSGETLFAYVAAMEKALPAAMIGVLVALGLHNLELMLVVVVASAFITAVVTICIARRRLSRMPGTGHEGSSLRDILRSSARVWLGNLAQLANYRLDIFLVATFATIDETGQYAIASALGSLIWNVADAVGAAIFPRVCQMKSVEAKILTRRAVFYVFVATVFMTAVAVCLAPIVIPVLFGEQFAASSQALRYLAVGIAMLSIPKVAGGVLVATGAESWNSAGALVSLVLTVGLDLMLIPSYGMIGAALASSVAYSAYGLIVWVRLISNTDIAKARC